jgi:hypothetical protein
MPVIRVSQAMMTNGEAVSHVHRLSFEAQPGRPGILSQIGSPVVL